MSALTVSRRSLLPTWTSDLFDTGKFFSPSFMDIESDFPTLEFAARIPMVNIIENTRDFKIEMAAPGMEKKDFHVSVENDMLIISSEKKEEIKEKKENYTLKEFSFSSFKRSFRLPENCLPEKIDAKYENGILKFTLPKKEVVVSKPVKEIKIS
jgi:HSP20 family protein